MRWRVKISRTSLFPVLQLLCYFFRVGIVLKMNTVTNVTEPTLYRYAIGWHATETPRHWSTDDRWVAFVWPRLTGGIIAFSTNNGETKICPHDWLQSGRKIIARSSMKIINPGIKTTPHTSENCRSNQSPRWFQGALLYNNNNCAISR